MTSIRRNENAFSILLSKKIENRFWGEGKLRGCSTTTFKKTKVYPD